jgi:uncharacterized membrane protein
MSEHRAFRLTNQVAPRKVVGVTLIFWALLLAFAWAVIGQPSVALIPLYGLCPTTPATDAWAIGAGLVFLSLAYFGFFRRSRVAAVAFIVLFFISIAGWVLRFH